MLEGREARDVEFIHVQHVPALQHNLLSVLFLTKRCNFAVTIPAPLSPNDCAAIASTLALDNSLWHRSLMHANVDALHKLVLKGLVTGLVLESKTHADMIVSWARCMQIRSFHPHHLHACSVLSTLGFEGVDAKANAPGLQVLDAVCE